MAGITRKLSEHSKDNKSTLDYPLLICVILLLFFGFMMDYSASFIFASEKFNDGFHFIKRHLIFLGIGLFVMFFLASTDYKRIKKLIFVLFVFTIILLFLTLIPGLGVKIGGARRWLKFVFFRFQTSELAKFTMILFLANYYSKNLENRNSFKKFIIVPVVMIMAMFLPIILQPDFSTVMLLTLVMFGIIFVSGVRLRHALYLSVPFLCFAIAAVAYKPYRLKRFLSFLDPWGDPGNSGYQSIRSFLALNSGGFFGVGLGESKEKLFYLPEAHNDFIFAVIGEELGFIGIFCTLACFAFLVYRCTRIAVRSDSDFARIFVFGVIFMIAMQVTLNMGVVLGLFPVTGLPLPFISYGGASLVILLALLGIVLNISRSIDRKK